MKRNVCQSVHSYSLSTTFDVLTDSHKYVSASCMTLHSIEIETVGKPQQSRVLCQAAKRGRWASALSCRDVWESRRQCDWWLAATIWTATHDNASVTFASVCTKTKPCTRVWRQRPKAQRGNVLPKTSHGVDKLKQSLIEMSLAVSRDWLIKQLVCGKDRSQNQKYPLWTFAMMCCSVTVNLQWVFTARCYA